jgi:hypothetical protein
MDGLRADDQGAHIQHAIERRNNVENWAPAGEGKNEPQELGHKATYLQNYLNFFLTQFSLSSESLKIAIRYERLEATYTESS